MAWFDKNLPNKLSVFVELFPKITFKLVFYYSENEFEGVYANCPSDKDNSNLKYSPVV